MVQEAWIQFWGPDFGPDMWSAVLFGASFALAFVVGRYLGNAVVRFITVQG